MSPTETNKMKSISNLAIFSNKKKIVVDKAYLRLELQMCKSCFSHTKLENKIIKEITKKYYRLHFLQSDFQQHDMNKALDFMFLNRQ